MTNNAPRGIAVFDVGSTNTKLMLFDADGKVLAVEKMRSARHQAPPYLAIDCEPLFAFAARALPRLDQVLPVDKIVTSSHGSALALLDENGKLLLPMMDYQAEPPADIVARYRKIAPSFDEVFCPVLPLSLTLGLQLFWQETIFPEAFAKMKTILPLAQYVAHCLGGKMVTELSALGAQSQLWDYRGGCYSSLARSRGWADKFAPITRAYEKIGTLGEQFQGNAFRGRGEICAGVHDSDANYLRYLAGIAGDFTLLSTGTWIIGFDTRADIAHLDIARDTVANLDIFGRSVACCRFFGGREFEIISEGARTDASEEDVQRLINGGVFALPSFTDSGGPMPGTGGKGRIVGGAVETAGEKTALASLYCALMVSESLDAIGSTGDVIIDGPFSTNGVFLGCLAALRPGQKVKASTLRDGTTDGARLIGLMGNDGEVPSTEIELKTCVTLEIVGLGNYQREWRRRSGE
jgi:sugar (pentulose or hexulose) kinase